MSGMLHPVGPEDPQVYWLRRAAIAVGVVLVVLVVVAIGRAGGSPTEAVVAGSPTPLLLGTPSPSAMASPTASPSATASPVPSATPSAGGPSAAGSPSASATPKAPVPLPTPTPCLPADLQVGLAGGAGAGIGKGTTFTTTITNGSSTPCTLGLGASNFALRITSGTDRIWTTADCPAWLPTVKTTVIKPAATLSTDVAWPGKRSYSGCKLASTALQPGTYVVTAEYKDAAPARKVIGLR